MVAAPGLAAKPYNLYPKDHTISSAFFPTEGFKGCRQRTRRKKHSAPVTPIMKKSPEPRLIGKQWSEKTIKMYNYENAEPRLI